MNKNAVQSNPEPSGAMPAADWACCTRAPTVADEKYIRQTWISSYRNSPWAGTIPNNLFEDICTETYNQLILRGMKLLVCSNPANPTQLLGWLAYEVSSAGEVALHYAFTKPLFRQLGIISHLLSVADIDGSFFYTHKTPSAKFFKGGKFRPEIARRRSFGHEAPVDLDKRVTH